MRAYFTWFFTAEIFMVGCRSIGRPASIQKIDTGWRVDYV